MLDDARVRALSSAADQRPQDAAVRIELGNLYFDAERFDIAASWYEAALKIDPKNVDASTDLGVSYYSLNQIDRALARLHGDPQIDWHDVKNRRERTQVICAGINHQTIALEQQHCLQHRLARYRQTLCQ